MTTDHRWEVALPNAWYIVELTAGSVNDGSKAINLLIEDKLLFSCWSSAVTTASGQTQGLLTATARPVRVNDGKLNLSTSNDEAKIAFLKIHTFNQLPSKRSSRPIIVNLKKATNSS